MAGSTNEITLGDDFGYVIIKVNRARISVRAGALSPTRIARGAQAESAPVIFNIGDRMPDGSIYAGSLNGRKIYAARGCADRKLLGRRKDELHNQRNGEVCQNA